MKCPECGAEVKNTDRFCGECGARIEYKRTAAQEQSLEMAGNAGMLLGQAARRMRMEADYSGTEIITARKYNAIMVGVLLWGLLVNVLLCACVGDVYRYIDPFLFTILYLVLAFAGTVIAAKSSNPLVSFLGYNMIVIPFGLVISTLVEGYGGADSAIVRDAFIYTALICLGMFGASLAFPELFEKLSGALLGCLIGVAVCELALMLFGVRQTITDWLLAGIFSFYIGYDIYRSQRFTKTVDNAVDCALDLYLDIGNLFIRILRLMARSKNRED